jgi:large subunit ribosomal protein L4
MAKLSVLNVQGKENGSIDLPDEIFGSIVNADVIYQAVVMYQAGQRQGNASTKERGSVSGGGTKPWRQKGTGRARAGSSRSPLWRGGGVVFGPHPRDFSYRVPKKIRVAALRETLNDKYLSKDLLCVDELTVGRPKTKEFSKILKNLKLLDAKTLCLVDKQDADVDKASRNIARLTLMRADDVNAYDVLRNKKVVVTKKAFTNLLKRLK